MKAFVSYSFQDRELYLITLLFEQLRKSGYVVETGTYNSQFQIQKSDVFIGIITNDSNSVDYVIQEWEIAKQHNIPNILIIENGINIEDPNSFNFIRFDRKNPNPAINELFNINAKPQPLVKKKNSNIENALITGGIIVGVAALISLLAGDKK